MTAISPKFMGALVLPILAMASTASMAQWPTEQPIKIIVPQAAGGTNDTLARLVGSELSKALGQAVVVENRPGASGAIGLQAAIQSKPDGYTLVMASDSAALMNVLRPALPWSFIDDLTGVGMIGQQPISVAVSAKSPYQSFEEVIAAARLKPGTLAYGSSGVGSSQNIVGQWVASLAGVEFIHIPYKGGGQATTDVLSGHTPMAVLGLAPMLKQHQAGGVRVVAITTPNRSAALPDVPTLTELGYPQISLAQWAGLVAPTGTPEPIVSRLSDELIKVLALPNVQERMLASGIDPSPMDYKAFDRFLVNTVETWMEVVPKLGIEVK